MPRCNPCGPPDHYRRTARWHANGGRGPIEDDSLAGGGDRIEPLTPPSDEAALVSRVLAGDESAFRSLYRSHAGPLYRLALRILGGSASSAEDALQEAWARAVHGLRGYEGRASLRTWLSSIVVRCCWERIRWERRDGEEVFPDTPAAVRPAGAEVRVDLERAFESLAPGYRTVLVLHDIEGYTHDDIAALLAIESGTSKSQLSRARAALRRALGPEYQTE